MTPKVVIIGIGFSSRLGLIRAVAQTGAVIDVIALCCGRFRPIDSYSKYIRNYYCCKGNDGKRILQILFDNYIDDEQKTILIPVNDFAVTVIDNNIDRLKEHFLFPHIQMRQGAAVEWMNKEKQKSMAEAIGLNVVHSYNIEIKEHTYTFPSEARYPCFTKTRAYVNGYKGTLHRCDDEAELRGVMDALSTKYRNLTIMVEDYKSIEKEYAVVGFSNGKNVVIPGIIEILLMAKGDDKGVACQGKIMPIVGFEDIVKKFEQLIQEIGFVGLFDIDFYLSEGKYYFGEINMRIGGSATAILKMGVNLPGMFVKSLCGESIDEMNKAIESSAIFVNERICSDNWCDGYLSKREMYNLFETADISFVKDNQDKKPEKRFKWELKILLIKRYLKKCLKK